MLSLNVIGRFHYTAGVVQMQDDYLPFYVPFMELKKILYLNLPLCSNFHLQSGNLVTYKKEKTAANTKNTINTTEPSEITPVL